MTPAPEEHTTSDPISEPQSPPAADPLPPEAASPVSQILKWVLAAVILALIAYPLIHRLQGPPANDPNSADSQLARSLAMYQAGNFQEAMNAAKASIQANPKNALAYNNLAVSYLQLHMYDDAIRSAQQALQLQPDLELAKNNLIWITQEKAKGSAPAVVYQPGTADYFLDQSYQHYAAGRYQQSIDASKQALKLNPGLAAAYSNMAADYNGLKQWDDAIANARKALQLQPDLKLAQGNLDFALNGKATAAKK